MGTPYYGGQATQPPQGRDDPKDWKDGGEDTLRDTRGGTYGTLPGKDNPDQVKEHPTQRQIMQQGADVRAEAEPIPETLPEGLERERIAPGGGKAQERK